MVAYLGLTYTGKSMTANEYYFEISEGILRNQKIVIGLDSFNTFGHIWIIIVFVSTMPLKVAKLQ